MTSQSSSKKSHLRLVDPARPSSADESLPSATGAHSIWGLTGGIASGKSTAAGFFEKAGIPVIDADKISRSLSDPGGAAHPLIIQRFGTADRAQLRERVFSDPAARRDLEAILHPLIQAESLRKISALPPGPVIYEATLLVETGRYRSLTGLIVVEAPRESRIARLMARDRCSREMALQILQSQLPDEKRREAATHVIENDGTLESLEAKVRDLAAKLR